MSELEQLRRTCLACTRCPLCETRTNVVFGVGPETTGVMFVGEGPGEQEDLRGEPFVGPAGRLLDEMLSIIDLGRHNCYIANIVKCRPPHNRDPLGWKRAAFSSPPSTIPPPCCGTCPSARRPSRTCCPSVRRSGSSARSSTPEYCKNAPCRTAKGVFFNSI